jgi:protocatechuate 3,4-dioxygenase beta subunit
MPLNAELFSQTVRPSSTHKIEELLEAHVRKETLILTMATVLVAPIAWALPASAAAPGDKVLTAEVGANRHVGEALTVKGTVKNKDDGTPIVGETVLVELCGPPGKYMCYQAPSASVKTGADGSYSAELRASQPGGPASVFAHIAGSLIRVDNPITLTYRTGLVDFTAPTSPAVKNTPVALKGRLLYTGRDGAKLAYTKTVSLYRSADGNAWTKVADTTADDKGGFYLAGNADANAYWRAATNTEFFDVTTTPTTLVNLKVAENKVAVIKDLRGGGTRQLGSDFVIKGSSELVTPAGARSVNAGAKVQLAWSSDLNTWHGFGEETTDSKGRFFFDAVVKGDAHWRVILPGVTNDDVVIPRVEAQVFVNAKTKSRVSANAGPEPIRRGKKLTVKGKVTDWVGGTWRPVKSATVAVYFRAKGSQKWHFIAWDRTDRSGIYSAKFKATRDGSWQVRFSDDDHFWVASPSDYVDVR